ncbi:hypothetical protein FBU59_006570, partial [Linderina macrospora]
SASFKFDTSSNTTASSVLPTATEFGSTNVIGHGPNRRIDQQLQKAHPLESRLANWESSQLNMKLHMQRRIYGLHAPMRTMMELQAVKDVPNVFESPAGRLQLDILNGRDETIEIEDMYNGANVELDLGDVHDLLSRHVEA